MQEEDPKFGNVLRNTPEKASGEIEIQTQQTP